MYLLVPVVTYNQYTEKEEGIILSLIDLTPASINSIDEIKEDKEEDIKAGVQVNYKNGDAKDLRLPFLEFLGLLNSNALVNFGMVHHCVKYSAELKESLDLGRSIVGKQDNSIKTPQTYYTPE